MVYSYHWSCGLYWAGSNNVPEWEHLVFEQDCWCCGQFGHYILVDWHRFPQKRKSLEKSLADIPQGLHCL